MILKRYEFTLDERQVSLMFAPLRTKLEVIDILMRSIKIMLINYQLPEESISGKLILIVSKMSRLFFVSQDKYFSINFPFTAIDDGEALAFKFKSGDDIDNKFTSDVLAIISSPGALVSFDIYDFLDPVVDIIEDSYNFWFLLREILIFEDGYIRFDHDEDHANGTIHPTNHLDVFYSSGSTFKIGLNDRIRDDHLIDLLNLGTDCHFLDTI